MKVYILLRGIDREGEEVVDVFKSETKANQAELKAINENRLGFVDYRVIECEVK